MLTVPEAIVTVRAAVKGDPYMALDAGFSKPLLALLWETNLINCYYASQGLSTMGYALPAANALALAYPDDTVIGFMGDGSMMMRATEIAVAVHEKINPIYIVFVDRTMTQIAVKQSRQKLRQVGVFFDPPSCKALAETFGAAGYDVDTKEELTAAIAAAQNSKLPTLIGIKIDTSQNERIYDSVRG